MMMMARTSWPNRGGGGGDCEKLDGGKWKAEDAASF